MDYLNVSEVAELKGCGIRYIQKLIKDGKLAAIEKDSAANNRREYLIPTSSLPEQLQKRHVNKIRKDMGLIEMKPIKTAEKRYLNTVEKPFEEYTAEEREQVSLWITIIKEWQSFRDAAARKTDIDPLYVAKVRLERPEINISESILYRKYAAYRAGYFEGLLDSRGGNNKGKTQIPENMFEAFLCYYLNENRIPVSRCYELMTEWVKTFYPEDVPDIPCERSFRRAAEKLPKAVIQLCRFGEKALSDTCIPYVERLYDELNANDVWVADNHTFDFMTLGENKKVHRMYLTAFIDAKSGVMVGWNLTENPSAQSTLLAFRHAILRFGVPKSVYFDNGSEFLVHDIGGRGHRTKASWNAEEIPPTILQMMGIEMHNALVRNAKAKPIERTFYTFKNHISKMIETFCGGTILERPESLKYKLKHGIIPEDEQIRKALEVLIDGDYNVDDYGGQENKYKGMSRLDVWNKSIQHTAFRKAAAEDLNFLLARTTRYQKVKRNGVFIEYCGEKLWYSSSDTWRYLDESVYCRYDPSNIYTVRIYAADTDKYIATWKLATDMMIEYITDDKDSIATAEANRRRTEKAVKAYAKGLTAEIPDEQKIDALSMSIIMATNGYNSKFNIYQPSKFVPVLSDKIIEEKPELSNITEVEIDFERMNANAKKNRKG